MDITFGKVAYVPNTPANILDRIGMNINTTAQNDSIVIVSHDTIKETLKTYEKTIGTDAQNISNVLADYLKETILKINGNADEIFFIN